MRIAFWDSAPLANATFKPIYTFKPKVLSLLSWPSSNLDISGTILVGRGLIF